MVVFNPQKKEIDIKVVYYGPALCGKTTSLKSVHLNLNPQQRGELVSLATKDDRTLFFDFLPIQLDNIKGFKTRFHIYTVPGQVFYTLTRKAVLTGVDGVIFVADSQNGKMQENIESLNDLKDNLKYYNKTLESIPLVFQFNKRDLPDLISLHELNEQLNTMRAPFFEASALSGAGVMDALTMCCKMVLKQMQNKSRTERPITTMPAGSAPGGPSPAELPHLTLAENVPDKAEVEHDQPLLQAEDENHTDAVTAEDLHALIDAQPELNAQNTLSCSADMLATDTNDLSLKQEGSPGETGSEDIGLSPPEEIPAPTQENREEGKRTCPRCSLKFKPNVKQCPICRITLVAENQSAIPTNNARAVLPVLSPEDDAQKTSNDGMTPKRESDEGEEMQQLEIISCDQPMKTSAHAVTIPLVMRLDSNNAEVKVDLTISFNKTRIDVRC